MFMNCANAVTQSFIELIIKNAKKEAMACLSSGDHEGARFWFRHILKNLDELSPSNALLVSRWGVERSTSLPDIHEKFLAEQTHHTQISRAHTHVMPQPKNNRPEHVPEYRKTILRMFRLNL